ncbi:NAD(P)/FAD-dependent oxidoreductase [Henriciella sp.]|uniref:NAD(P)/FAD-dependent oxidoreductase n=1 Tax=Henriciella sp. TaxID=1968823 RepID=UPI0025C07B3B|nr:NAD(P)/FAD-dependent oxidoreductase [Henriciella sp.]
MSDVADEPLLDVIVIGAGAMGLAAAHHAAKAGCSTLVLEAGEVVGGMAAHFDFDGISLERFYHFMCLSDEGTFELLEELGLRDRVVWRNTKMGYLKNRKVYPWGNPVALLTYPHLNPIEKFRYGLMAWWCTKRRSWDAAEPLTAPVWLKRWLGESCYQKMWHRLLHQKFFQFTDKISATWIGTRIQRIGQSRESLMKEKLGYIEGGTQTLVDALVASIRENEGDVLCSAPVQSVTVDSDGIKTVTTPDGRIWKAREIISTAPTPIVPKMIHQLSEDERSKLAAIENIGVVCLVYKLAKPVTGNFWLNIMDEEHAIPGLIEFSALRDFGDDHVVYAPYYMPIDNERWAWSDEALLDEAFEAIRVANPDITQADVTARMASRLKYSQPICTPNFLDRLPAIETSLPGVQVADTSYYYPEDRGISQSVALGKTMARHSIARLGQ